MLESLKLWIEENKSFLLGAAAGVGATVAVSGATALYKSGREKARQKALEAVQDAATNSNDAAN